MKSPIVKTGTGRRIYLMFAGARQKSSKPETPAKDDDRWTFIVAFLLTFTGCILLLTLFDFLRKHTW
ncbi:hypothetical protein [Terriglobus tenax]|uniref:hypothetical protein n=1 Tax=Terriglobus tenax TaxID=1111115 RepID=UPI0021E01BCB|nr:hypothetical protein [Terriglobus tenax]